MPQPSSIDSLLVRLGAGIASSPDLEQALGASQSWMSRTLNRLMTEGRVVRIGSTRGARYGLRRDIEGIGSSWPLRSIDRSGSLHELGILHALAADQYYLEPSRQAIEQGFAWGQVTSGLPYYLQDQRPGGFLGRAVPLQHADLHLPQRVIDWTDDHYLRYLTLRGSDTVGNLLLGRAACDEYLERQRRPSIIEAGDRESRFPQLAEQVMEGGLPGSSAHGEHPKFAVAVREPDGVRHVLVKFSPPIGTALGQRWSDLLFAEHHAHAVLRAAGVPAATSRIFRIRDRTYLQMDRFDREGLEGRVGVTSLLAIDTSFYGKLDNWGAAALRLHADRRIDATTLEQVLLSATFGSLIANTDRHFGNLAFFDAYDGKFGFAPVYDMLPMLFAPDHEQIVERAFVPAGPSSDTLRVWGRARALAETYWRGLADDPRISDGFRTLSGTCLQALEALPRSGAYAATT